MPAEPDKTAPRSLPDWSDPHGYERLAKLGKSAFAWEWLRRCPAFRRAAVESIGGRNEGRVGPDEVGAWPWNLHAFENPDLGADMARPLWRREAYPYVLAAAARRPGKPEDAFDLAGFARFATLVQTGATQHLLLSDGLRDVRLDIWGTALRAGPVELLYHLRGVHSLGAPLLTLRRFHALVVAGRFSTALHPPARRARRLILLLRATDALRSRASQREIAAALLQNSLEQERWRLHAPSIRSQAQRLVSGARRMAEGGFWTLLR